MITAENARKGVDSIHRTAPEVLQEGLGGAVGLGLLYVQQNSKMLVSVMEHLDQVTDELRTLRQELAELKQP